MPLPVEASFKRKGEYAPAANDDGGGNETTPYKPVPLHFNQADATTIRNRENDRMNLNNDHDATPLTFEHRRSSSTCPSRRNCIIICVIGVIIFFTLVLPLALTYGRKSKSTEAMKTDSGKLNGNITLFVSSISSGANLSFEHSVLKPRASVRPLHDRQVRKISEYNSDDDLALKPLKDLIIEALTIYSRLCTTNQCTDAALTNLELDEDRINTGFVMQLAKGHMPNLVADKSMLADLEPNLKVFFPKAFPNYAVDKVETDVDFDSFCSAVNCFNDTESSALLLVDGSSSANLTDEADWRDLNGSDIFPLSFDISSTSARGRHRTTIESTSMPTTTTIVSTSTPASSTSTTTNAPTEPTKLPLILPVQNQTMAGNCTSTGFACKNGLQIIPINHQCDGVTDCKDGSDEINCAECRTRLSCLSSIGNRCLRGGQLCDSKEDCTDGFDESAQFCRTECKKGSFRCSSGNKCISNDLLCDGDAHCPDQDDETVCISMGCKNNAKWCAANSRCIPVWKLCDDKIDCSDGSDEAFCPCPKKPYFSRVRN